jgi:hypothetical protein
MNGENGCGAKAERIRESCLGGGGGGAKEKDAAEYRQSDGLKA